MSVDLFHAWTLNIPIYKVGGIRYLMPLSTIFQLYRGSQFYWGRKPEYIEKTTDLSQVTLSYNVASSTPRLSKIWTHVNGDPMYKETFLLSNKNYYNYRYSDNYFWQICALWQWQSRRKNNQMLSRACIIHLVIKKTNWSYVKTMSCSGSHLGITINIKNTKFVKDLPMIDA